jgi:hypothetical protein
VVGTPGKVWTLINMKVLATERLKVTKALLPVLSSPPYCVRQTLGRVTKHTGAQRNPTRLAPILLINMKVLTTERLKVTRESHSERVVCVLYSTTPVLSPPTSPRPLLHPDFCFRRGR